MKLPPLLLLAAALLPAPAAAMVRMAVLVGNNTGLPEEQVLQYATRDAEQVRNALEQLGGVDKGEARLLLDGDAEKLMLLLRATHDRILALRARGQKVQLLVYYSGHGSTEALHMNGGKLPVARIRDAFRDLAADLKILIADACFSGALIASKGGSLAAPVPVTYVDELKVNGSAILTSSSAGELSQESRELRGSIFTHFFLSAIRGAGDADRDGAVTLWEAYTHTLSGMRRKLASSSGAAQNPEFELDLHGSENVVLTRVNLGQSLLTLKGVPEGRYQVLEATNALPMAEVNITDPEGALLALPRGHYLVYRSASKGGISGYADLRRKRSATLGPADFKDVTPGGLRPKGVEIGWAWPVRLSLQPRLYSDFPGREEWTPALEAALRLHAGAWSAYAAIDWLSADEKTIGGARFRQGGMGLAGGFHRHWRPWARICFFLGPRLEYWFLDQSLEGGGNSGGDPRAAGTLASLGLETALGAGFSLSAAAEPGYHWGYYSRGGLRADPALAAVLNLGFGR